MSLSSYSHLNSEQRAATQRLWQDEVHALQIVAGAGSGKTTTLTAAILAAIDAGYGADSIAALTFSRRAAHELRARLNQLGVTPGYCGTIHGLAWKLICAEKNPPRILKDAEKLRGRLARRMFKEYGHIPEKILLRKNFLPEADSLLLHSEYAQYLRTNSLIDFDTMISNAAERLLGAGRFAVVFVDEFQDTSPDQFSFIQSLAARKYLVVGDDWQSIYKFRGADVRLTREFTAILKGAKRVYLVRNYRSDRNIVKLGNRLIRQSGEFVKKQLKATKPARQKAVCFYSQADNATIAWHKFTTAIQSKRLPNRFGKILGEKVTILVRTNAQRHMLEKDKPNNFDILTIHKSKGLEFDNVLVFGIAEHSIPHRDNDYDEEVRILYVALTRARKFLGFIAWETGDRRSEFLPLLMRQCSLAYF